MIAEMQDSEVNAAEKAILQIGEGHHELINKTIDSEFIDFNAVQEQLRDCEISSADNRRRGADLEEVAAMEEEVEDVGKALEEEG